MKKRTTLTSIDVTDLKLRMAEHIIAQNDCYRTDDVQTILTETRVGAWRRADLLKKLQIIFSAG